MADEYVRTCPACNAPDVRVDFGNIGVVLGFDYHYRCNNCGYSGKLFPETPVEALEAEEYEVENLSEKEEAAHEQTRKRYLLLSVLVVIFAGGAGYFINPLFALLAFLALILFGLAKVFEHSKDSDARKT